MSRPPALQPKYCLHKRSGQSYIRIGGRQVWLGKHGSQASRDKYQTVVGEWIAQGRPALGSSAVGSSAAPGQMDITVGEIIANYWDYASVHYRPAPGHSGGELSVQHMALEVLAAHYGDTPAAEFGPLKLKSLREIMIRPRAETVIRKGMPVEVTRKGWCRSFVNRQINRIIRMFRWGAENELISASIHQQLSSLSGLRRGKTTARESEPVEAVDDETVAKVTPLLPPPVRAMVALEAFTAMRPGEVRIMRACDIDMSKSPWVYRPQWHKTDYRGDTKEILIGPRAQEIIRPYIGPKLDAYLFRPADAVEWEHQHRRQKAQERGRHYSPSELARITAKAKKAKPRKLADHYTKDALATAIRRACKIAGVKFTPNQLRHKAAKRIREEFGLDAAQVVLGHSRVSTTQVYAEKNRAKAAEVMGKIG